MELLTGTKLTVNGELLRLAVRRAFYFLRFGSEQVRQVLELLDDDVHPDVVDRVRRYLEQTGTLRPLAQTTRGRQLAATIDRLLGAGYSRAFDGQKAALREAGRLEARGLVKSIENAAPVSLNLAVPNTRTLDAIVATRPARGKLLATWWEELSKATASRVKAEIEVGIAAGDTTQQIVRAVRESADVSRRSAETLVRTAASHVSTHAREETYRENEDVVEGVVWVSTLDSATCVECASLDGQEFDVDDGPRPPEHASCRCTTTPKIKSWKQLGIKLREAPPGTRASMDGQAPDAVTYREWLEDQPLSVQEDVLGVGLARLYRSGRINFDDLTDTRNRPLTLAEVEEKIG